MTNACILKNALLHSYLFEITEVEKTFTHEIATPPNYDEPVFNAISEAKQQEQKAKKVPKKFTTILIAAIVACITMILTISSVRIAPNDSAENIITKSVSEIIDTNESYKSEPNGGSYSCGEHNRTFFSSSRYQSSSRPSSPNFGLR